MKLNQYNHPMLLYWFPNTNPYLIKMAVQCLMTWWRIMGESALIEFGIKKVGVNLMWQVQIVRLDFCNREIPGRNKINDDAHSWHLAGKIGGWKCDSDM